jgi:transposase-like protein
LLSDLMERGVDFTVPRLYVPDGCRAPTAAIRRHAGDAACIQRCQVHERRNVLDHLPEQHQPSVERKLNTAYSMVGYQDGPQLGGGNGGDLDSGKLSVPEPLRKSLASANIIESAFSVVETACHLVKRWREGDHREHCLAPALLTAESKFRRTKGYREIPRLMDSPAKMQQFR